MPPCRNAGMTRFALDLSPFDFDLCSLSFVLRPSTFDLRHSIFSISAFQHSSISFGGQRGRGIAELSGGVNVAFVKDEAYKRFEDLQRRAVELGRYL